MQMRKKRQSDEAARNGKLQHYPGALLLIQKQKFCECRLGYDLNDQCAFGRREYTTSKTKEQWKRKGKVSMVRVSPSAMADVVY